MLRLENIEVGFPQPVLQNLSLGVGSGECFGILGTGGIGKTVLLKTIAGLIRPTQGTVAVQTERVTMTFQRSGLFDSMTAEENLQFVLREAGVPDSEWTERVEVSLNEVGLSGQSRYYPHELSGGMQKRLGIARALLLKPELILYDDPTAGLDPVTSRTITDLIQSAKEKYQMTVVIATSDLKVARNLSTRVGLLSRGKIIFSEKAESFFSSDQYDVKRFVKGIYD